MRARAEHKYSTHARAMVVAALGGTRQGLEKGARTQCSAKSHKCVATTDTVERYSANRYCGRATRASILVRRVGGEGEGNLVSKHEILAAPTTGLARNVRHTGAAKKHVSVIQHLPSLVTRSRRPEDSRKGGGGGGRGGPNGLCTTQTEPKRSSYMR